MVSSFVAHERWNFIFETGESLSLKTLEEFFTLIGMRDVVSTKVRVIQLSFIYIQICFKLTYMLASLLSLSDSTHKYEISNS